MAWDTSLGSGSSEWFFLFVITVAVACSTVFVWNVTRGVWLRLQARKPFPRFLRIRVGDRIMTYDPDHPSHLFDERFVGAAARAKKNGPSAG
jgi:hypothetical protein